jgi:RNA polymerase sigma-70 factor (ECF subfamily)
MAPSLLAACAAGVIVMAREAGNCEADAAVVAPAEAGGDESQLVARAKSEPQAFGQLYERYYGKMLSYIFRRTLDVALAEALTSNTFFNALRALPGYDHRGKFGAWLYRIAGNEIRLHWRGERSRRENDGRWREEFARLRFAAGPETAEDVEEKMRQFARLHDALSRLPERYQTALALRYFEDLSYDEVADVLGRKTGTVKSLIHRGLARLKRQFELDGATFIEHLHSPVQKECEP